VVVCAAVDAARQYTWGLYPVDVKAEHCTWSDAQGRARLRCSWSQRVVSALRHRWRQDQRSVATAWWTGGQSFLLFIYIESSGVNQLTDEGRDAASFIPGVRCPVLLQVPIVFEALPPHHSRFTALFPGPPGWAGAKRELLDFMVQGKINRGRHTDHLAGRHSIRTNQCLPPPSPIFLQAGSPSCRPINSVKALKD